MFNSYVLQLHLLILLSQPLHITRLHPSRIEATPSLNTQLLMLLVDLLQVLYPQLRLLVLIRILCLHLFGLPSEGSIFFLEFDKLVTLLYNNDLEFGQAFLYRI